MDVGRESESTGPLAGGLRGWVVEVAVCEGDHLPSRDGPPALTFVPSNPTACYPLGGPGRGQGRGLASPPVPQPLIISRYRALAHSPVLHDMAADFSGHRLSAPSRSTNESFPRGPPCAHQPVVWSLPRASGGESAQVGGRALGAPRRGGEWLADGLPHRVTGVRGGGPALSLRGGWCPLRWPGNRRA